MKKIRKEQKVAQHRVLALLLGGILVVLIAYQEWLLHMPSYTWPFLWNRDAFLDVYKRQGQSSLAAVGR